jgi:TetR/AcrR family tetracycline transcriptional repressor
MSPKAARRTKSKLDREVVIEAALGLADAEGLEAVSVRRIADQFGVTPMALYWHFDDKEALLAGVADRLWVETAETLDRSLEQLSTAEDDGWGELRRVLDALVTVMQRHPSAAELVPSRVLSCEAGRNVTELTLGFLSRKGFEPAQASDLALFLLSGAVMLVSTQAGIEIHDRQERLEHQRQKRIALASLPPDRYPHIAESAGYLTDCETPETYVARGCDAIIAGVRAQAPSP